MAETIKIIPCSLENQKPTTVYNCFLELTDTHIQYKVHFLATEPVDENDKGLGLQENVINYFDIIALKGNIAGVELSVTVKGKRWCVAVIISGFGSDLKVYFRTKESAEELFTKIKSWVLNAK